MKRNASIGIVAILVLAGFITIAQNRSSSSRQQQEHIKDTLPQRGDGKVKDFDEALQDMDRAMQDLNAELKKPIPPIPPIEVEKMKAELDRVLIDIDPEKMKVEIDKAMKQIDAEKIRADVEASLAKIDMEKIRKDIEHIKEVEIPKIEAEMKKMRPEIERSLKEAKVNIEKAKAELQDYKDFESSLEKEGLINKKQYTIEHKNGELIINGQKQPEAVYNKYHSFLSKHKKFTLKKNEEGLDINNDKGED